MDKAQLSEIRARLRAAADREVRPRRPLLAPLLGRTTSPPAPEATPYPPPRRVGLNPSDFRDDEAAARAARVEAGRNAFGQRTETRADPLPPLLLPAPDPVPETPRWPPLLTPRPAAAVTETPYRPEDFSDPAGEAERLYAAAGLVPIEDRPKPWIRTVRAAPPEPPAPDPARELLSHLERVFLAEQAGLDALRL